jgi:hypothetical protein
MSHDGLHYRRGNNLFSHRNVNHTRRPTKANPDGGTPIKHTIIPLTKCIIETGRYVPNRSIDVVRAPESRALVRSQGKGPRRRRRQVEPCVSRGAQAVWAVARWITVWIVSYDKHNIIGQNRPIIGNIFVCITERETERVAVIVFRCCQERMASDQSNLDCSKPIEFWWHVVIFPNSHQAPVYRHLATISSRLPTWQSCQIAL